MLRFIGSWLSRFVRGAWVGALALLTLAAATQAQTVTLHVDGDNGLAIPNPPDPGDTWTNSFKFLQDALARAAQIVSPETPVQIWVAATDPSNPYRPDRDAANPNGTGDRNASFNMGNSIQLIGGFLPGHTQLAQRDPESNLTVLSGDLNGDDVFSPHILGQQWQFLNTGENSWHVVRAIGVNATAVLNGFRITGGNANNGEPGAAFDEAGGGMLINGDASPRIIRCTFVGNRANAEGGGVALFNTDFTDPSKPLFANCVFIANEVLPGSLGGGGAVFIAGNGGAIFTNCLFFKNRAPAGGAISYRPGFPLFPFPVPEGVFVDLLDCTIARNHSASIGGGIFSQIDIAPFRLRNNILWGNTDNSVAGIHSQFALLSGLLLTCMNNCIQDTAEGDGFVFLGAVGVDASNIDRDPQFSHPGVDQFGVDLFDLRWATFGPAWGTFTVKDFSPCIDMGDVGTLPDDLGDVDDDGATIGQTLPLDLDSLGRVFDPSGGQSPRLDMGSYEYPYIFGCREDLNHDGLIDGIDLGILLAQWTIQAETCNGQLTCPGDINADGLVNGIDLGILLEAWGPCPAESAGSGFSGGMQMASVTAPPPLDPIQVEAMEEDDIYWLTAWYVATYGAIPGAE